MTEDFSTKLEHCYNEKVGGSMIEDVLELHFQNYQMVKDIAKRNHHPVPIDTRAWSQILVSEVSGIKGLKQCKGPDLIDGSDVKAALAWGAIDKPRFNGVIKPDRNTLDSLPFLFLVLWDKTIRDTYRCRIWIVRPQVDKLFRELCSKWYAQKIRSFNFQLHPPLGKDNNELRNRHGSYKYPLYFCGERDSYDWSISCNPDVLREGLLLL